MDKSIDKLNFNQKKGFICDMDGVIYHGNRILPGVAEAFMINILLHIQSM